MVFCGVQFLYPSFLWAMGLLALPVLIHLFNFRRPKKIVFSDIRFLKQIAIETKKQKQVKHLLVLAMRMLMLFFLVLAFAQPFIPTVANLPIGEKLVSVYLDNSYSMSLNGERSSLLEEAKNKARLLADAYGDGAQYQIINNNFEPDQSLLLSKKAFLEKIEQTKWSVQSRNAKQIYHKQLSAFQSKFNPYASLYWISDAQKSQLDLLNFKPDSLFPIHFMPLASVLKNNIWIDTVWMDEPFIQLNKPFTIHVRITNNAESDIQNQALYLLVDQKKVNLQNFNCKANQSEVLHFNYTVKDTNWHAAAATINDYPLVFDDTYNFILKASAQINVLQLYANNPNPAFKNLYQLDAAYHLAQQNIDKLNSQQFGNQQLVILDGIQELSSGMEESLLQYLKDGGLVLMLPALENASQSQSFLNKLGIRLGDKQQASLEINEIQTKDALFKQVFTSISAQTLYPKVTAYFPIESNGNTTFQQVLGLSNGQPYAIRKQFGKGQLILAASAMRAPQDQFVNHAFFVPFLLNMPFLTKTRQNLAYHTNQIQFLPVPEVSENNIFTLKKANQSWQCQAVNRAGKYCIEMPALIQDAGVYNLYNGSKSIAKIALNDCRTESKLLYYENENLEKAGFQIEQASNEVLRNQIQLTQNGHALWRYCIIAALVFILLEMLLLKSVK